MPTVKLDSNFASSILDVAVDNDVSKAHAAKAAERLKAVVITPILAKLNSNTPLEDHETKVLDFLVTEHSSDGLQWGGAMPEQSKRAILADKELQKTLLTRLSDRMTTENIMAITEPAGLAGVMKAITDCSFTYVERFPKAMHGPNFDGIKDMITPTPEELAIRVQRTEMGQTEHRAISFGIGTEVGKDIAPVNNIPSDPERMHKAGKAAFATADAVQRAKIIATQYDKQAMHVSDLESKEDTSTEELAEAKETLENLAKQMDYYRVPKNPGQRPANFQQLNIPQPSIQKLARLGGDDNVPLPLVATASGTTARALIALHDLGVFNDSENNFDPESAQYLSTLLCGTIVHGGHHSVLEVGEMYNRLLDYEAISDLENKGVRSNEETMGYYEIGASGTLVPEAMREDVLSKYNAKNQADFKQTLKGTVIREEPNDPSPPQNSATF
ncbi:hypothetical protein BN59_02815 [Legionella massiliensis]|uniref:Uncharacterized protein n=1 Tax=Legionella massiliensis TaxID=1034943 RepID=A0A078KVQ3_9GAMM|nr:hypothetical protein [Legionella massiliensis]CDZ78505.1 hypothetical protein BN59_02815 [Legionella massiliensis]CEE14243.1 hypothetical protein BN1094_02815 [Legionella massiliensis]